MHICIPICITLYEQEATNAVLDALIERIPQTKGAIKVYYSLLEANDNGDVLGSHSGTNFKYIVNTDNKV